uniref:Uncharacterized protein n=1 Tax=Skeletonema marinoi TaxID=267567 RepID=A0A7S2LI25_9STRA|mmetsp:Transcript_25069/g.42597  ORF Transcript_25069/g.42597 Transcript_25069/m.42597 type:complete len:305 (+) Transcript_25069:87-1001(+)
MESSKSTFTMPLPKLPMDELYARVRESLERMDRQEYEKKRRREALQEKRWRERCKKRSNGDTKSPLFPTWASAGALSSDKLLDEEEVESSEPLEADAVGSSSCCMAKDTTSDEEDSSPEPPYISKYAYLDNIPKPPPPEPVPEEELIRRRKVEQELIALSKKITEEKLRKERMIPFVPAKPTFDPFPNAAADSSDGDSSSKEPQNPNPRKRPYSNLTAIGVPPQARSYYAQSSYGPGGYMGGCYRQYSEEEVNDFVAFVDKWIPTDPKWKKKKPSTESSTDDDKKSSTESSTDDDKETVCNKEE